MKVAFIGASKFGLECLSSIRDLKDIDVAGVISNNQRFSINYNKAGVTNVLYRDFEEYCVQEGLKFYRMEQNMKEDGLSAFLTQLNPDVVLVIGWYHMIPKKLLETFPFIGIHASLLPDYSGGAPLVWAIINGETRTGVTLFYFDEGVDSGDIIGQEEIAIENSDTIKTLYDKVESIGKDMLARCLPQMASGNAPRIKQDESKRRIFPQRNPDDGLIDWSWDAGRIRNFIRAQTKPYPGAFTILNGKKITIWDADVTDIGNP